MSSVMPFTFNAVKLCVVTINEKPWTRAREACRALEYNKKTADIVKTFCSGENYAQKWQLNKFPAAGNFMDWPKDSRKNDCYINEEGMYEIVFSNQQPLVKDFRRHCCNVLFPHAWQQLINKMKEDHQQAIGEKDATIALFNDDLKNRDNQIQAIQYESVALQAEKDVYQAELQKCQDTITHLETRYVPHPKNPGKDNIIIIRKHTPSANDKFHDLPCYIARIQRRKRYVKLRWFDRHFPDHEVIADIDKPNSIHAFNRFEEEFNTGRFICHRGTCHP